MSGLRVTVPEELRAVVERVVADGEHESASAYVADLVRRDRERRKQVERMRTGRAHLHRP